MINLELITLLNNITLKMDCCQQTVCQVEFESRDSNK